jgi:Acyl-CoA carboxylase epsilon subunit
VNEDTATEAPAIRIVRGHPTVEEIAAFVVALSALSATAATPPAPAGSDGWAARWRGLRTELRPGPQAWRFSGRR